MRADTAHLELASDLTVRPICDSCAVVTAAARAGALLRLAYEQHASGIPSGGVRGESLPARRGYYRVCMGEGRRYDVALSFAGEDREYARSLAENLVSRGVRVFYDEYEAASLWGKDLYSHLTDLYQNQATYMIAFFSEHYALKLWTTQELRAAQARAFTEGREYVLAVRLDETIIPGFLPTIAYRVWAEDGAERLADLVLEKLGVRVNHVDGAELVRVPEGEVLMGSDSANEQDQHPERIVTLSTYYVYKYPVTAAQYRKFCAATGYSEPAHGGATYRDDFPVVDVNWHDAEAYSDWAEVRLPTEAEWEKAARGTDGRNYPWGNEWDTAACEWRRQEWGDAGLPVPVTAHPRGISPFGAFDMVGNTSEWCADWYDSSYYRRAPSRDPRGPESGAARVRRGCHWADDVRFPLNFWCSFRNSEEPRFYYRTLGFRCVAE